MSSQYVSRHIPRISLADFSNRIDAITAELVAAAEGDGFFSLVDTGISIAEIDTMFGVSESFFALPDSVKETVAWTPKNVGWEKRGQIRPSTGTVDQKESYQLQFGDNMQGKWIGEDVLPEFREEALKFMNKVHSVSEKLLVCFARGLNFPDDYFVRLHDPRRPDCQSVLRLIHYFALDETDDPSKNIYRAGAHADWDLVTLLFQRPGQNGLEFCPGRDAVTSFGIGDNWTKVDFEPGDIICNTGDLLMSWSDDRFKSTFHRVQPRTEGGRTFCGERYSLAYFNQPCLDCEIQGPLKKYPKITGAQFTKAAMDRNYAALKAKQEKLLGNTMETTGSVVAEA